ncbi:uncharacterized protein MONOS_7299 [Monocercomonoides exilis]|uniref:uncharacterized protein n=1 Tax=Monocercomonoides exilis TaxID=2049356 RepID=UPI00355AB9AC|nr:hypothetical protein MONOS_7299 [Monocercomonoides exilis]|eukprot:MONOS_7299.1-p1 / transcript=MONOS_7299.1 / gene=MONOS_7299 / organism=Monocercomonoides_exilis_PA203 / gene_product=unspecified product / transcript_product=unspecified product / location=Mono_scaffold00247:6900-7175(+) / protein_length=71 / sequence_SO=supercontig / SO=protein_coding / is_pseudo=false
MECEWCRKLICIKISSLRIAGKGEICLSLPIVWNCKCWPVYVRCSPSEKIDILAFRCNGHWRMPSVLSAP